MSDWTSVFSGARGIHAIYGSKTPSLNGVCVHEVCVDREGPVLKVRADLSDFPDSPPEKWRRSGANVVQVEFVFVGIREVSLSRFSVNPVCDLLIRGGVDGGVYFSGVSDSLKFSGVSDSAMIARISGYQSE